MKITVFIVTLFISVAAFANDAFVVCGEGKNIPEAVASLNQKLDQDENPEGAKAWNENHGTLDNDYASTPVFPNEGDVQYACVTVIDQ